MTETRVNEAQLLEELQLLRARVRELEENEGGSPRGLEGATKVPREAGEEKGRLEEQLRQAQKLESLGVLAGGIAHDFNNILCAIIGYADLGRSAAQEGGAVDNYLKEIRTAGERGASLVSQILAFSHHKHPERELFSVRSVVREVAQLLRGVMPANIKMRMRFGAGRRLVLGDRTQIHQVVMNLCTNAYHAMRDTGGELGLGVVTVDVAPAWNAGAGLQPGPYERIRVSDTGCGMSKETAQRAFEPFFTTKRVGEGTGMGLSTAHEIVTEHGGSIVLRSEKGEGSLFDAFLPIHAHGTAMDGRSRDDVDRAEQLEGDEHVLLIEDDRGLLKMIAAFLRQLGYRVTAFGVSSDALRAFRSRPRAFDVVVTDQTMPDLTGAELSKELMHVRPDVRIILCSGFSEVVDRQEAEALGVREYLAKPFLLSELARTIRTVMKHVE